MILRVDNEYLLDPPSTRTHSSCGPHLDSNKVLLGETQAISHTHLACHHPVRQSVLLPSCLVPATLSPRLPALDPCHLSSENLFQNPNKW